MPARLLTHFTIAVLITFVLVWINPRSFYLRSDSFSIDWLCAITFIVSLFASQAICFGAFKKFSYEKRWATTLFVSIPTGIFSALLLYSFIFSIVWAAEV